MSSEKRTNDLGPQFVSPDQSEGASEQEYTEKKK